MLRGLFGDGSLNELLFPTNGEDNMISKKFKDLRKNTYGSEDEDSDGSDNEMEGALIIKMLGQMLAKKKSTAECIAINKDINLDKLRKELREYQLEELREKTLKRKDSSKRLMQSSKLSQQTVTQHL